MIYPLVALKDCCVVIGGATPKRNISEYWGNDIPWVTPKDVSNMSQPVLDDAPEYISQAGYDSCSTYLLPKGAILLTSRAPIGNVAIAGHEMCTNQGFKSLIPGKDVDSRYLYHCIKNNAAKLQNLGNGATFKEVSKKIVEAFEILLPPLKEQRRIAAILDKADAIRRKRQRAIELTETFLRSVFLDMFGDPVMNPKRWKKKQLKYLVREGDTINYGVVQPGIDFPGGVPIVRVGDFKGGSIDKRNLKHIDPEIENAYQRSRLTGDEILVACVGSIGEVALVNKTFEGFNIARAVSRIRCSPEVNRIYLALLLSTPAIKGYFISQTRVVAQPTLNIKQIKETEILLPPIENQIKFVEIYNQVKQKAAIEIEQRHRMGDIFRSLAQKAFKGELTQSTTPLKEAISA